jgi:hypothetical protein
MNATAATANASTWMVLSATSSTTTAAGQYKAVDTNTTLTAILAHQLFPSNVTYTGRTKLGGHAVIALKGVEKSTSGAHATDKIYLQPAGGHLLIKVVSTGVQSGKKISETIKYSRWGSTSVSAVPTSSVPFPITSLGST